MPFSLALLALGCAPHAGGAASNGSRVAADSALAPSVSVDVKTELAANGRLEVLPSYAAIQPDGSVRYHLVVWLPEANPESHAAKLATLRLALALKAGVAPNSVDKALFKERAWGFVDEDEKSRAVRLLLDAVPTAEMKSDADGLATFAFKAEAPAAGMDATRVSMGGVLVNGLLAPASVQGIPPRGISVVSDIDDTIKITNVTDQNALLRSTFFEPFKAVPEMASVYKGWSVGDGAAFHYVSMSPWQLFGPLRSFVQLEGFPWGTLHLRSKILGAVDLAAIQGSDQAFKFDTIARLLEDFPERSFVLIGDNGESDPRIYGDLARSYGSRIKAIFIRNTLHMNAEDERLQSAFANLPRTLWRLFESGSDLPPRLAPPN